MRRKLGILSTHPIQYNAPLFRLLSATDDLDVKVFFSKTFTEVHYDVDFQRNIQWDVPLTEGYAYDSFSASAPNGIEQIIDSIRAFGPDALLVYGWNFTGHFKVMRHFKNRMPIWFRGDSTLLDPLSLPKQILRKIWLRYVYRFIDCAFYVGEANRAYFKWCGVPENHLVYAPHAIDNDYFRQRRLELKEDIEQKKSELGIGSESVVFLFAGKLEDKKQPIALANAFISFPDAHRDRRSHLIIVGSGPLEAELLEVISDSPSIHYVGFQNQSIMPLWYGMADVLCLLSIGPGETWGLAVNEAMACGCLAMVSDRVGCASDLITHENVGSVVSATSQANWPNEMLRLADCVLANRTLCRERCSNHIARFSMEQFQQALHSQFNMLQP